jgi:DNA-directed RNA polymerase specialized sigma24 family protein
MRYFAGMTEEDIAGVLDISEATVRRDWRRARACLYELLQ